MSKNLYVGISGKAREGKEIYVGIGGKARKVVAGYVGVNGKARKFWPSTIIYVWNRYNINIQSSVYEGSVVYQSAIRHCTDDGKIYQDYYISGTSVALTSPYSGYLSDDEDFSGYYAPKRGKSCVLRFVHEDWNTGDNVYEVIELLVKQTQIQGSYIDQVFSENPSQYPKNGISGNYWYVYQGTQG